VTALDWIAANVVVAAGAAVQGTIGFGLGLLAAPVLVLLEPRLVPGPLLVTSLLLSLLLMRREWHGIRIRDLGWSVPGRFLGTAAAVLALRVLPPERFVLAVGLLVLVAVGLSASGWHAAPTPVHLFGAGAAGGFMGTVSSIGGPPMAIVYQHEEGPRLRGTLAVFFLVGVLISLAGLAIAGRFGPRELRLALGILPGIPAGYAVSFATAPRIRGRGLRSAVLAAAAVASGVVVVGEMMRMLG
jgi:uncharacterized membrane protein YfcA